MHPSPLQIIPKENQEIKYNYKIEQDWTCNLIYNLLSDIVLIQLDLDRQIFAH